MHVGLVEFLVVVHHEFVVRFEHRTSVFTIVATTFFTAIRMRRERHFFCSQQIIGSHRSTNHGCQALAQLIVHRSITIYIIFVVTSQPLFGNKPWVVVALILSIYTLNTLFTRLPNPANIIGHYIPVCTTPNGHIVNQTVRSVVYIIDVGR